MSTTRHLPLLWTRVVILTILFGLAIMSAALCIKTFIRHNHDNRDINKFAPSGVNVDLKYNEIRTTDILLYLCDMVVTIVASKIIILLLEDRYHFMPPFLAQRFSIVRKLKANQYSTSTLHYQAGFLLLTLVLFTLPVSFLTHFVYTGTMGVIVNPGGMQLSDAEAAVQAEMESLGISTSYRHIPYVRSTALASWSVEGFLILSIVMTLIAWRRSPRLGTGPGQIPKEGLVNGKEKRQSNVSSSTPESSV